MAEIKEENERAVYEKSTLERILEIINQKRANLPHNIVIKSGRSIGILTFIKDRERVIRKCYAVSMVVDKTEVEYIYDEKGDNISRIVILGDNIYVSNDPDIILDREILLNSIKPYQDTENDNQGRHIANQQERIMSSDESVFKDSNTGNNEIDSNLSMYDSDGNIPINWVNKGIKLKESAATVYLKNKYNGRELKDLFDFPDNLKNKLPSGTNISNLNHLGLVDSAALTEKDGKKRENELTFVAVDDVENPKYMVELDYLKPLEKLSKQEDIMADKTSKRYGDGGIQKGASTTTDTRFICGVIIGGGSRIGQTNDFLSLEVRYNPNYIDTSKSQKNDANNIEIHLGVQDISSSHYNQEHRQNKVDFKLEGDKENYNKIEQFDQRREFENYLGPDDEFKYSVYGESKGEHKGEPERNETELNMMLKNEQEEQKNATNKKSEDQYKKTAEISSCVTDVYRKMAQNIAKKSELFGENEVYDKIISIKNECEKNNIQLSLKELRDRAEYELNSQRVIGDTFNSRRHA